MKHNLFITILILVLGASILNVEAQSKPKLEFTGQLSLWGRYSPDADAQVSIGHRYIPKLNYAIPLKKGRIIDFEASANTLVNAGIYPESEAFVNTLADPYRIWARYSANQFELRAGLQKISFGSASILRPLMWFDRIDPRDPQQITNGVYGALGRYYFQNNANIWVWGLIGNEETKGWEAISTDKTKPEAGGRVQLPLKRGEIAGSYHFRMANPNLITGLPPRPDSLPTLASIPESRMAIDCKLDLVVGLWFEGSWTHLHEPIPLPGGTQFSDQTLLNAGIDYTFPVGNGLNVVYEQLIVASDEKPFAFANPVPLSATSISYPMGLFDNLNAIVLYDWSNQSPTAFLNWQRSFDQFTFYLMAFYSPSVAPVGNQFNSFGGQGAQSMLIFNH